MPGISVLSSQGLLISSSLQKKLEKSGTHSKRGLTVSPSELSAAVNAVKRRIEASHSRGDLVLSERSMTLTLGDGYTRLGSADVALLKALAMAPDGRLPYWRLFEVTGRDSKDAAKAQLELQVFRLRKKVAGICGREDFIRSIRFEGYQLTQRVRLDP